MPYWSNEELNELEGVLKKEVEIQQMARKWVLNRINWPINLYPEAKLNRELLELMKKI